MKNAAAAMANIFKSPGSLAASLFFDLALFIGLLSLVACFDAYAHIPYVLASFRFQYLIVQIICFVALLLLRKYRHLILCIVLTVPNLIAIYPYLHDGPQLAASEVTPLKLCQINVNCGNTNYAEVLNFVRSQNPDVVLIEELTPKWDEVILRELPNYKYSNKVTQWNPFGIGIYSRLPLERSQTKYYVGPGFPVVISWINLRGKEVRIIHTHPRPALSAYGIGYHRKLLAAIAQEVAVDCKRTIVAGDFNTCIWTSTMRNILDSGRLRSSANGYGWLPTWPRSLSQWKIDFINSSPLLMIPIDHCLVGQEFAVKHFTVGKDVHSDHLPLAIDLELEISK